MDLVYFCSIQHAWTEPATDQGAKNLHCGIGLTAWQSGGGEGPIESTTPPSGAFLAIPSNVRATSFNVLKLLIAAVMDGNHLSFLVDRPTSDKKLCDRMTGYLFLVSGWVS